LAVEVIMTWNATWLSSMGSGVVRWICFAASATAASN